MSWFCQLHSVCLKPQLGSKFQSIGMEGDQGNCRKGSFSWNGNDEISRNKQREKLEGSLGTIQKQQLLLSTAITPK